MKQLCCEICGSNEILKQDGVFVCQKCGCRYSAEEVKKIMYDGDGSFETSQKEESSNLIQNYKELADTAYDSGNKKEAYLYYLKVLELNPKDYHCIFFKGMCQGWETTMANPRVKEAVSAYVKAVDLMPDNERMAISLEYVSELIRLLDAWYKLDNDFVLKTTDWYLSNLDTFSTYQDACATIIQIIDPIATLVLNNGSNSLIFNMGFLYCRCCAGVSSMIQVWTDYSQNNLVYHGHSRKNKQSYLDKYDNMVFEVRKTCPDFERTKMIGGIVVPPSIERLDPPQYWQYASEMDGKNKQLCIQIDQEIEQRVQKWRIEKEKEQKRHDFLVRYPAVLRKYNELCTEKTRLSNSISDMERVLDAQEAKLESMNGLINSMNTDIESAEKDRLRLQNKIFGKTQNRAKAQEINEWLISAKQELKHKKDAYDLARAEHDRIYTKYNEILSEFDKVKEEISFILRSCGLE